jgi:hypothetical protein
MVVRGSPVPGTVRGAGVREVLVVVAAAAAGLLLAAVIALAPWLAVQAYPVVVRHLPADAAIVQ